MYESFFGLQTRPFSAIADQEMFVATPALEGGLRKTLACLHAGNGPVVVTGESGTGKTAFCGELVRRAGERLQGIVLSAAAFANSLEFCQAILFELGREFAGLTDHEARLRVLQAARSLSPERDGLLLVVDDAHRLEPRLLDKFWQLTTHLDDGTPLVRLVLSGQLELEERLASPELDALNQHLGSHVVLEPLTGEESRQFIAGQLQRAGADVGDVFTGDALALICRAGDGNCRALNQLCDHSLLLAYVEEQKPVTDAMVQSALDDLKGLPQHWNDVAPAPGEVDGACEAEVALSAAGQDAPGRESPTVEYQESDLSADESLEYADDAMLNAAWDESEVSVIEVGDDATESTPYSPARPGPAATPTVPRQPVSVTPSEETREFGVDDAYARLDRLAELGVPGEPKPHLAPLWTGDGTVAPEQQILAQVEDLREDVRSSRQPPDEGRLADVEMPHRNDDAVPYEDDLVWDVIEPELDEPPLEYQPAAIAPATPVDRSTPTSTAPSATRTGPDGGPSVTAEGRRYAQLFTRLKRRRRDAALRAKMPLADR